MRILFVASGNKGTPAPFIREQAEALQDAGIPVAYFTVQGKGLMGYLAARKGLIKAIHLYKPEVIHAHYGLCGLLATLQCRVPVVTTFHGSDVNERSVRPLSRLAMMRSRHSIFVSQGLIDILHPKKNWTLLPCGVDLTNFPEISKAEARSRLGWDIRKKMILFSGAFDNPVKNAKLAKEAVALLPEVEFLELKGFSREEVCLRMLAADALLMTSFTEGSPQVIKEALAAECPIVSVDVGDVKEITSGVDGCWISDRCPEDLASKLQLALSFDGRTTGRERLVERGLDNRVITEKLIAIYRSII